MPKASEARVRANEKYNRANCISVAFRVNKKTDADVLDRLERIENKRAYLLGLIRNEIKPKKWVLRLNDEDEVRHYELHAIAKDDAIAEADQIISLFSGWMKGRIDKSDWCIVQVGAENAEPIYLFR